MRQVLTLVATYTGILLLAPIIFDIFRFAGAQFIAEEVLSAHSWLLQVITYTPVLLLLVIFLFATLRSPKHYGFVYNKELLGVSLAVGVVSAFVIYFFGTLDTLGLPADPSLLVVVGYLVTWGLLGPLVEEFFFRGFMQTSFTHAIKHPRAPYIAIALTVVFEVLFHMPGRGWVQVSYLAVFGVVACWVYMRTKSLLGPFIIHAVGNAGALVLFWLL